MAPPPISGRVRFGAFEVDLVSGELRKQGIKIKIHDQPFRILTDLLAQPGQVITRDQLVHKLWRPGTFVDSDTGLNSAMKKLRDALGDSAENPRFIETLPRRGYRFLAEVHNLSVEPATRPQIGDSTVVGATHLADETHVVPIGAPWTENARPVAQEELRPITGAILGAGRRVAIAAAFAFAILAALFWWVRTPKPNPYTIAVLPLKNLSTEPGSDYFSDGLTDELIRNLSIINGLEVKSRTSSFSFKETSQNVRQIGSQLGVNLILDGSVLRAGNKLRVDVQLIRVADDHTLWSARYDRDLKDVFAIQDEISQSIVNELRLRLGNGQRRYSTSVEAYDEYLKGLVLMNGVPGPDSDAIEASIPAFERAIAKDPNFAPAYARIADAYADMSATPRIMSTKVADPKIREACEKALRLDPLLAEARACMGLVYARAHSWTEAEKEFRRALDLDPNLTRARQDFAIWVLLPMGRIDEAVSELRVAKKLDPLSKGAVTLLNFALMMTGKYDEVIKDSNQILVTDPNNYPVRQVLARALLQKGQVDAGIDILEKLGTGSEGFLGYACAKAGRSADAERIAAEQRHRPWMRALIYGGLGDKDRTYEGLEGMLAQGDPRLGNYTQFPELSVLRDDKRLTEIRREMGLPMAKKEVQADGAPPAINKN